MRGLDRVDAGLDLESVELGRFSRSFAEIEWLLLILVILYSFIPGTIVRHDALMVLAMVAFAAFVLLFRYTNVFASTARSKLLFEALLMTGFITLMVWNTGRQLESPLVNLYLLVVVASAIALDRLQAAIVVGVVALCYVGLAYVSLGGFDIENFQFGDLAVRLFPVLLVAYLTTVLASGIQSTKRQIKRLSETDELTGLLNTRAFNQVLHAEGRRLQRLDQPYALMMMDADGLKAVNDSYGHEAGNRFIRLIADTIRQTLRDTDVLARFGGDEFVALLPNATEEAALRIGHRIAEAVRGAELELDGRRHACSVSIGVASGRARWQRLDATMEEADRALYASKEGGRDRVTAFSAVLAEQPS